MKRNILSAIGLLFIFALTASAQNVPPPPTPVVEKDLRDNTIKMRSIELERVKRDANKASPTESTIEREIRFAKVKEDFEGIQKLQDSIIEAYTTGKKINYSKISKSAMNMWKSSLRLDENLFGASSEKDDKNQKSKKNEQKSVRNLIIELDDSIGKFIESPIFKNTDVVDTKVSEMAQRELKNITKLSNLLSIEAEKIK